MSHFMDNEAFEDDEELSDEEAKAKLTKKRAQMLSSDEDDDEEEDEEKAKEEMAGFIADDSEEEQSGKSGSGSDSDSDSGNRKSGKKRHKKRHRERSDNEEEIDDDDMELIQENLGIKIKKKRKRIQMDSDDDGSDAGGGGGGRDDDMDGDGDLPDPDAPLPGRDGNRDGRDSRQDGDGDGYESEDVNDFIVDDEGNPIQREKKRTRHIFSDSARQNAEDIFGVAFDYGEFEEYGEDADDVSEAEEDDYESDMDDDGGGGGRKRSEKRGEKKGKRPTKTIFDAFRPDELEAGHYTELDNEIRNTDIPERMQLRATPVTSLPEGTADEELEKEAEWIFRHGFTKATVSKQDGFTEDECSDWTRKEDTVVEKIKKALDFMRQQFLEVPFIAFYRKEYVLPELKINDLWRVYHMDELYCKLQQRKQNLKKLYANMQLYQGDSILADPEAPLPEGLKVIDNEDVRKVEDIDTFEELKDWDQYFKLYFSRDIEAMRDMVKKKKKEEREARRLRRKEKKKKTKVITNEDGEEVEVTDDEAVDDDEDDAAAADQEDDDEDDDDALDHDAPKQAKRNDVYSLCKKFGLMGMASRFGLSPTEFGENLKDGYSKIDVRQDPSEPMEAAAEYLGEKITKPEDVMTAAKNLMAAQIAHEPLVRKETRMAFFERATLTVVPTKKGLTEIDEAHDCYALKFLKKKPVKTLSGDAWLRLTQAEESKLVTLELAKEVPSLSGGHGGRTFLQEAQDLFKFDAFSKSAQEWNSLRAACVEIAFKDILFPMLRKELRLKLTKEAKDGVIRACRSKLYEWIKVGKYSVKFEEEDEDEWDTTHGCRIMAVMYENDLDTAAYAVSITVEGEVVGIQKLQHIIKRKNSYNDKERMEKEKDLETIRCFILKHRPHAVVVGAADRLAISIKQDIQDILKSLVEGEHEFPHLTVSVVDDNLAKVYANSARAKADFPQYPNNLLQAISLARRFQDPLVEFSQLTGTENEILCLRYHPLQDLLSEDELLEGLSIEFINRTNEVGVDINLCVMHAHMSNLVQFVGGLGPRKGANLLKTLRTMQSSQKLESREQLVSLCHMGPQGIMNCAGFIKIDSIVGDSDVEVLDSSRIHIEAYEWARKMAVDALEYDEGDGRSANALEEILKEPDKLSELDLEAFAKELERQGFGKKSITLCDIRSELYHRYKDLREPYSDPDPEEEFNLVTKETPATFYIGKLVTAVVTGFAYKKPIGDELQKAIPLKSEMGFQCPFCGVDGLPDLTEFWSHVDIAGLCPGKAVGVKVRLDNGISGFVSIKNLSDKTVINPEERVKVRSTLHCRIIKIQPERFSIEGICKSSALVDENNEWRPAKDDYYDQELEDKMYKKDKDKKRENQQQQYTKRVITHQSFLNINYKEAESKMADMDQGDVIIRPSSKGEDRLTVTWKVHDGIYQHIDVKEQGKVNSFSLGQSLWIGLEEFEDLDEIIARHVNPMANNARDILNFRYYRDTKGGNRETAEEMLRQDKAAQPSKIHYFLSASKELPGKFMLSYLPRTKARHEYVTITPDGFRFRKNSFESVGLLVKWFKEHFRDPIPGTPITPGGANRPGTNRGTPFMTPSGGGGGITPGAMSTAMGTPYTRTPVGYGAAGANINTPYTPSGQTPVLTPYNTPGPAGSSHTPRHQAHSGSNTPRSHRGYGGGQTPRGGFGSQGQTPVLTPFNTPGPPRSGVNTPRGHSGNQGRPGVFGQQAPSNNSRQQQRDRASRFGGTPSSTSGGNKRTPKGGSYGADATPLYDE